MCTIFICTCKPEENSGNPSSKIDSCVILKKMIQQGWYYNSKLGYYRDSFDMGTLWVMRPAFRACFSKMTESYVKFLFGNPQDSNYCTAACDSSRTSTKYYLYYTYKSHSENDYLEFHFKNGYLFEVDDGIDSIKF